MRSVRPGLTGADRNVDGQLSTIHTYVLSHSLIFLTYEVEDGLIVFNKTKIVSVWSNRNLHHGWEWKSTGSIGRTFITEELNSDLSFPMARAAVPPRVLPLLPGGRFSERVAPPRREFTECVAPPPCPQRSRQCSSKDGPTPTKSRLTPANTTRPNGHRADSKSNLLGLIRAEVCIDPPWQWRLAVECPTAAAPVCTHPPDKHDTHRVRVNKRDTGCLVS